MDVMISLLKIIIIVSIFYVWVVRYSNIVKEFNEYNLPNWFRDSMGIIKLSCSLMIISAYPELVLLASSILVVLMLSAVFTHIKAKHSLLQMVPSFGLMISSALIGLHTLGFF